MKVIKNWIIIRNGSETRLVKTLPHLAANEVAVEVVIKAPSPPRVVGTVTIELPEPPPAFAEATAVEYGPEDLETPDAGS